MRDRVDLERSAQDVEQERQRHRRAWLGLAAMAAVALLLVVGTVTLLPHVVREPGSLSSVLWLVPLLLLCVGGLVLVSWWMRRTLQGYVNQADRASELARQALGEESAPPPVEKKRRPLGLLALYAVGLLALLVLFVPAYHALNNLLARFWPNAPGGVMGTLLGVVLVVVGTVGKRAIDFLWSALSGEEEAADSPAALPAARGPGEAGEHKARTWPDWLKRVPGALLGTILSLLVWAGGSLLMKATGNFLLTTLLLVGGGFLVAVILPASLFILPAIWVQLAQRQADYGEALRRVEFARRFRPDPFLQAVHGVVLGEAGRHQEAEQCLRQVLAAPQGKTPQVQSMALDGLGYVLMEQERYEEAIQAFEGAIAILPQVSDPYGGLAELYLRQGVQPQRALELANQALQRKQQSAKSFLVRWLGGGEIAALHATQAWALALMERPAEAEQAMAQALSRIDRDDKKTSAALYYRAGQVMRLLDDQAAAVEHLGRARQLDPKGNAGRLAARAMREIGQDEPEI